MTNQRWLRRTVQFLGGQTITLFGSSIVQFTISWHITRTTQSGLMITIATLCGFLPQVLISLFAGIWADRYNRKVLIMAADGMIAAFTAVLAILYSAGHRELWLLFIISAVRSVGAGIQTPAVSAFLTELVPQDKLMRVNGLNASITSVMMLLSPAAAAALYGQLGLQAVFWVDVGTAAVGISLLLFLKTQSRQADAPQEKNLAADMLRGLRYVFQNIWLAEFLLFYLIFALMFGPVVFLTPLMVARSFGNDAWRLMAHEMLFSIGSILGGILIGALSGRIRSMVHVLVFGSAGFGLTTLVMGFSPNFIFYLCVMLLMGFTVPFINTSSMTLLQTHVEPSMMGRVFGLVSIIGSGMMPLSMVVFGPTADAVSVEHLLILTGALMLAISACSVFAKHLWRVGRVPAARAEAQGEEPSGQDEAPPEEQAEQHR